MKFLILLLLLLLHAANGFYAQLFTKITNGAIVNTPGDSRGVNIVDVNNDGLDDVFITNGPSSKAHNLLYINTGNGTFYYDSLNAIVHDTSAFDGATFGDADNDGDLDAYVVTWYNYKNYFYRNTGTGSFVYEPGTVSGSTGYFSETASWGDYNRDGLLDLYVTNSGGNKKNLLYQNLGSGTFTQITTGSLVNDAFSSRCVNWTDFDNDNDLDLFITNENNQLNNLYQNNNGSFTKLTSISPVLSNKSSMSSSWADIDNDGDLDLFVGNSLYFAPQNNQLYVNNNDGTFTEVNSGAIVNDGACTYGSAFTDYDNDGDQDLFVSNGFYNGTIHNLLYKNDGSGGFTKDTLSLPSYTTPCSYGCAWGDLNNDGFQDLAVSTCRNSTNSALPNNLLYLNNGNGNSWLELKLNGSVSNKNAIGAKIYVTAVIGGSLVTQLREVSAQTGQCGQNSMTQHFGLGNATLIQTLQIQWPSGLSTYSTGLTANTLMQINEPDPVGLVTHNNLQPSFTCYPNPVVGKVTFDISNPTQITFQNLCISNLAGQQVMCIALNSNSNHIVIEENTRSLNLSPGLYFAQFRSNYGIYQFKLMVRSE